MKARRRRLRPWTLVVDAATGLAIFLLFAGILTRGCDGQSIHLGDMMPAAHAAYGPQIDTTAWAQPSAGTLPLAMINTYPSQNQIYRNTTRTSAFLVLGAVFTLMFVANMALYRHLRAYYAPARRRQASEKMRKTRTL